MNGLLFFVMTDKNIPLCTQEISNKLSELGIVERGNHNQCLYFFKAQYVVSKKETHCFWVGLSVPNTYEKECIFLGNFDLWNLQTGDVNYLILNQTHSNFVLMLTLIQAVSGGNRVQYASLLKPHNLGQLSLTTATF